jgi:NADH:ubiquinone oxidoreductase subunit 5 (subunit L)/multisubunit Na+/H+ antiporter MnhA subunit
MLFFKEINQYKNRIFQLHQTNCSMVNVLYFLVVFSLLTAEMFSQEKKHNQIFVHTIRVAKEERDIQKRHSIAFEMLISTTGFGLGGFYRTKLNNFTSGTVNLSVAEVEDEQEIEFYDIYGNSIHPGKINRFLLIPLYIGIEQRVFTESISETFRPFVNFGIGPAVIFFAPAQQEFFSSLGNGRSRWNMSGYVGVGTYWGNKSETLFGFNVRYIYAPYSKGIESLENTLTGEKKSLKEFGGIYITLSIGNSFE